MNQLFRRLLCLLPLALAACVASSEPITYPPGSLEATLEAARHEQNVPALAVIIVDGAAEGDAADPLIAAAGVRNINQPIAATADDQFHIGSNTKSMTAVLAARLIEQDHLTWETTIADALPDLDIHPDYRDVTITQLLSHRGGAPGSPPEDAWAETWERLDQPPVEQRRVYLSEILAAAPAVEPGTAFIYSNEGYAIAGHMLETIVDEPWESLMQRELFEPLGMNSAGFGAPATLNPNRPGEVDQPWGHTARFGLLLTPVPPGPDADNPPAIGPAGTVHLDMADYGRYLAMFLAAIGGDTSFLSADSTERLYTLPDDLEPYALGWLVAEVDGRTVLMHSGSNTMFFSTMVLDPANNQAVAIAGNAFMEGGEELAFELLGR